MPVAVGAVGTPTLFAVCPPVSATLLGETSVVMGAVSAALVTAPASRSRRALKTAVTPLCPKKIC